MTITIKVTDEEREAVEELKERVKSDLSPALRDDETLFYRFSKARDFDVDNAEKMLRKHMDWRKENKVDTLLTDYKTPEIFQKYFPYSLIGFDKEGCPIRYAAASKIDIKGLDMSTTVPEVEKYMTYSNEIDCTKMKEQSEKLGKRVEKCVYILDFKDLSFADATNKKAMSAGISLITTYQDNYPERLKCAFVINTSMYFTFPFAVVKCFIPNSILSKIRIHGEVGWKEELLEMIHANDLPEFLGGNKTDPDKNPMCPSIVNHGGPIPERYHVRKSKKSVASSPGVKKLTLGRASFSEVIVEVEVPSSLLEWEFETKSRDIGFGIFYQEIIDNEEKITELIPIQRIDTEEYPETGMYRCEKAGTYVVLFDNSYSWVRAKEIFYRTTVVKPEDHEIKVE